MAGKAYSENDYLYSSARVRALENRLIGNERLARLCELKTTDELFRALEEAGFSGVSRDPEAAFSAFLAGVFENVREMTEAFAGRAFDVWRYPYDAHNVKCILKSEVRGRDPSALLSDCSSVPPQRAMDALRDGNFEAFPENMGKAAKKVRVDYAKTHDPKLIDVEIDRACYADMLNTSREAGIGAFVSAIRRRIDLTNLLTAVRLLKRRGEAQTTPYDAAYLENVLLDGGNIPVKTLTEAYESGYGALAEKAALAGYGKVAEKLSGGVSLSGFEKICDDCYMELYAQVRYKVSGAEVVAAYIAAAEYEVKNLRLLLSSRDDGQSGELDGTVGAQAKTAQSKKTDGAPSAADRESVKERLRESYVR